MKRRQRESATRSEPPGHAFTGRAPFFSLGSTARHRSGWAVWRGIIPARPRSGGTGLTGYAFKPDPIVSCQAPPVRSKVLEGVPADVLVKITTNATTPRTVLLLRVAEEDPIEKPLPYSDFCVAGRRVPFAFGFCGHHLESQRTSGLLNA